ncbi:VanZ family protein [Geodermatophilus nigrescens]
MVTTSLVEHAALVPVALLVVLAGCTGTGWLLLRRRPHDRRAPGALALLGLLPVVALTLTPTPRRAFETCAVQLSLPSPGSVELLANVALFVPAVFFAALATRRPVAVLLAAVGASAAVEAVQAALPALGRSCDTNDLAMNAAGAALAAALAAGTTALAARRPPGRS